MLKVYGSKLCPDCRQCISDFNAQKVEYEFLDITEDLANLKAFLALRDSNAAFEGVRASKGIGIPAIVKENGEVALEWGGCC